VFLILSEVFQALLEVRGQRDGLLQLFALGVYHGLRCAGDEVLIRQLALLVLDVLPGLLQLLLDAGLLLLLALVVLTYSTKNALMLFVLAFLIGPMGLPMVAVGLLSMLSTVRNALAFS